MQNQKELIQNVLYHCAHFSPYYREQSWAKKVRAGKQLRLRNIPITSRDAVRDNTALFYSDRSFPEDGEVESKYTSGSTGEPMEVRSTMLFEFMNQKENSRLQQGWWHDNDISTGIFLKSPSEEKPFGLLEKKSPNPNDPYWGFHCLDAKTALEIIHEKQPEYLCAYPSLMLEILKLTAGRPVELSLKYLSTVGETVSEELLDVAQARFGCKLYDAYGAIETGIIAAKCAQCGDYHPAEGHMAVEILRNDGLPVRPGETGNVVVTPLFNSAMPLIRYNIGDLATLSNKKCTISKMSISQILGRQRHTFKLADGRRITPMLPAWDLARLGVRRYKLIQTSLQMIEFHYVPERMDVDLTNEVIQPLIDTYLDPDFTVDVFKKQHLPRLPGGKYLMHESMLPHDDA
jgi:phenylacetate-CoA ligase